MHTLGIKLLYDPLGLRVCFYIFSLTQGRRTGLEKEKQKLIDSCSRKQRITLSACKHSKTQSKISGQGVRPTSIFIGMQSALSKNPEHLIFKNIQTSAFPLILIQNYNFSLHVRRKLAYIHVRVVKINRVLLHRPTPNTI